MADGGDPCECVWSHEMAMRRLISLLRQSQSHCNQEECFDVTAPSMLLPNHDSSGDGNLLFLGLVIAFFLMMLAMRPRMLNAKNDDSKPNNNNNNGNGQPPPSMSN